MLDGHSALRAITTHYTVLLLFEMIFRGLGCLFVKSSNALDGSRKSILMVDVSLRNDSSARDCAEGSSRKIVQTETPLRYFLGASKRPTNAILGIRFLVEDPSVSQKMPHEPMLDRFSSQIATLQCLQCSQETVVEL